jgi:hypothetical protein
MNNIKVTTEIRDRILNNINQLDLNKISNKVVSINKYKKYLSIAACFAILLVGSVAIHNTMNFMKNPVEQTIPEIIEYSSLSELSEAIGFSVKEVQNVPFEVEKVQYNAYWKELGEIQYIGENNTLTIRVSAFNEDISGDYSVYSDTKNITISGHSVTIKGDDNKYSLAVWESDGISYSMNFEQSVPEQVMVTTINSLQQ